MYTVKLKIGRCLTQWTSSLGITVQRLSGIYSSATQLQADNTGFDPDTFGQLAARSGNNENLDNKKNKKLFPKLQYTQVGKFDIPKDVKIYQRAEKFDSLERGAINNQNQSISHPQPNASIPHEVAADQNTLESLSGVVSETVLNESELSTSSEGKPMPSFPIESTINTWRNFAEEEYRNSIQDDSEEELRYQINKFINGKSHNKDENNHYKEAKKYKDKNYKKDGKHYKEATNFNNEVIQETSEIQTSNRVIAADESNSGIHNVQSRTGWHNIPINSTEQSTRPSNPNTFGTLTSHHKVTHEIVEDEGDKREEEFEEARLARKHRPQWYGKRMNQLCKERKLSEALQILEVEMPSVNAKPNEYCYNVLINACGKAGYTKKAFQLYNRMKERNLKVQDFVYTGLFMACANSPWPTTDGLDRATQLRQKLMENAYPVNEITSHAMIKAFGFCGDIKTAFQIVDEMLASGLLVTTKTMNFLLQACITDTTTGFRHAIMVWRKMRDLNLSPDIYSYNLLIRCTAECQAGDPILTSQLLNPPQTKTHAKKKTTSSKNMVKVLQVDIDDRQLATERSNELNCDTESTLKMSHESSNSHNTNTTDEFITQSIEEIDQHTKNKVADQKVHSEYPLEKQFTEIKVQLEKGKGNTALPNILGRNIITGSVIGLGALDKPEDRLALLGGMSGLIGQMMKDKVKPDLKTVTQMVTSLPSDKQAEEALIQAMKTMELQLDTQFCNMMIRKRTVRGDLQLAKEMLDVMQEYHLLPDLITFGCLALGCRNFHDAKQLLNDMDSANFRPNLEIMSSLTKNGIVTGNFYFVLEMLREMTRRDITPNTRLLNGLELGRTKAKRLLLKQEENGKIPKWKVEGARLFLMEYKTWLKASKIQLPEHPWAQYKKPKTSVVGEA